MTGTTRRRIAGTGVPFEQLFPAETGPRPESEPFSDPRPQASQETMPELWDAIVIGGGHNGLTTAAYLARTGARVLVIERRRNVGGACVTEETWPGFYVSTYAYAAGLLRPEIVRDLNLHHFGLRTVLFDPQAFQPFPNGRALSLWKDTDRAAREIEAFSHHDAVTYPRWLAYWEEVLELLSPLLLAPPAPLAELLGLFPGVEGERLIRDLMLRSVRDLLDDWFESDELKGTLGVNGIIGTFAGPSTPGSAYVLAHHSIGTLDGERNVWGLAVGGMGSITQALRRAAEHGGTTIATGVGVRRLLVHDGRAAGVETTSGERLRARVVASSLDARQTFLTLAPPDSLPSEFRDEVGKIRYRGAQVKFNAALDALPEFSSAPGTPSDAHRGSLEIAPSLEYLDRAFDEARQGRFSAAPFLETVFQSVRDPSVAPAGKHTMTCFVQYAPYELRDETWEEAKPAVAETILSTLETHAPNVRKVVRHYQVVSPVDLEHELGLTGGSIFQGDITPDQILGFRPVPGWSGYRTPLPGLYLCGAAAHPGGGVLGAPGRNAAGVILADLKAQKA